MTSHDHPIINPPLGGFLTGFGQWTPGITDALWQTVQGGAYWSGIVGELGVQFRVLVASTLGEGGSDFLYDDPAALYDTATYSTGEITWFDLTSSVEGFSFRRGKSHLGGRYNAGTANVTFNNDSGLFNPLRGQVFIGNQVLRPGRIIGFQGKRTDEPETAWRDLWIGRIETMGDVYVDAAHRVLSQWSCADFFNLLSAAAPPELSVDDPATVGQLTGARIEYIWSLGGYDPTFLDADAGTNTLIGTTFPGSRLDQIQAAAEAEGGEFFQSREGKLTFRQQDWLFNQAQAGPSLFIGQDGVDLKIIDATTSWDSVRVRNQISFTAEGGLQQNAADPTSQAQYGIRSFNKTGLQNDNDVDVFDLASYVVNTQAYDNLRIDSISVWASTMDVVTDLLEIEIGDVVQVQINTAFGWDYTIVAWVMGVDHNISHTDWKTTLRLDNTDRSNPSLAGAYSLAYSTAYKRKET